MFWLGVLSSMIKSSSGQSELKVFHEVHFLDEGRCRTVHDIGFYYDSVGSFDPFHYRLTRYFDPILRQTIFN